MSKLNEEIINTLEAAREYLTDNVWVQARRTEGEVRDRHLCIERLDRLMEFFYARRHIEECRVDEEKF